MHGSQVLVGTVEQAVCVVQVHPAQQVLEGRLVILHPVIVVRSGKAVTGGKGACAHTSLSGGPRHHTMIMRQGGGTDRSGAWGL